MPLTCENPPGIRLPKGSTLKGIALGFRCWAVPGGFRYIQHEHHRYYVKILSARLESHRTRHGRLVMRTIIDVQTQTP